MMTLIVICCHPFSANAQQAIDCINQHQNNTLQLFFYGDGAYFANRLVWLPDDRPNLAKKLQTTITTRQLPAQVCVSTALARGITDSKNAKRHQLCGDNLADGFELVGLGELAMHLHNADMVYQF